MEEGESETCRAVVLTDFGGYEKLKVKDIPKPEIKDEHVIIEVKACGMNFADLYTRQGIYTFRGMKPPFVLGSEAAGIISEIGAKVEDIKMGDRVLCWSYAYNMFSEFVLVHKSQCYPIPENMTYMEANCIVNNYLTAYLCIVDFGNLRSGQSVLIQAAAGGVGWAATQIAKSVENVTVFGTSSPSKHDLIRENGVTHAIDYTKTDFVEEILKISPLGVNVILDCLSGNDFTRAQKCLKPLGRIIHIGITGMMQGEKRNFMKNLKVWWQTKDIGMFNLINNNNAVCGLSINNLFEKDPDAFRCGVGKIIDLYKEQKIKPRIDSVWSFDEIIEATKCMVERKNIGKIILVPKKEDNVDKVEQFQN
ncbi:hypothetical protein JTE90_018306 [Oedothorax gibbosus]|uniref:Enoyl reductase (ER) domain-containing protein n=1 Tax=Oedothorax gibbosus TaxID=931172 RepID=A0AAV6UF82_9ARAC|nr:hypothetical protein JTE90_018306 [Oedothorax gibbosus]